MSKISINLSGVNETMLVPVKARAIESKRKNPNYYDEYALKIIEQVDYDFDKHKSKMNYWGISARTIYLDNETKKYIERYPECTIVNIACGLDSRFYRIDNGKITWYNLDFENVMSVRDQIFAPQERVYNLEGSALDFSWMDQIKTRENVLFILEGFVMYLTNQEAKQLFDAISKKFKNSQMLCELMSEEMVKRQKKHETTQKTSAVFKWGIKESADVCKMCPSYKLLREHNLTDLMKQYSPILITLMGKSLRKGNNRIGVFEM